MYYIAIYLKNENITIHNDNFRDLKDFLTLYQANKQIVTKPNDKGEYILFENKVFKDTSIKLTYDAKAYMQKAYFIYDSKDNQLFFQYNAPFYHYIYNVTNLTKPEINYSLFNKVFTYKGIDLLYCRKGIFAEIQYFIDNYKILITFDENYNVITIHIFEQGNSQPIHQFFKILNIYEEKVKPHLPVLLEFLKSDFKPEIIHI